MVKGTMNLQDSFLNQIRKDNTEIKLVLLDGTTLTGHVKGFDNFTVIVADQGSQHLIYKHAIAQIINDRPAPRREPARGGDEEPIRSKPTGEGGKGRENSEGFNTLDLSRVAVS